MMKRKAQRGENVESETQDPRERERGRINDCIRSFSSLPLSVYGHQWMREWERESKYVNLCVWARKRSNYVSFMYLPR